MKKYLVLLLTLLVSTFSLNSFAFTVPPKPADNTYVLDQTGKLSGDQVTKLNTKIEALNKSTKNEYAIVLLKTLDGAAIEDAAQDTFRAWGVGKANLNNGVMIMVALAERKTRIQTGKNAEGDLPDLLCKDILDHTLKPLLKKGDFYGGFDATLDSVVSHMESREKEKAVVAAPKELPNAAPADVTAASQSNSGSDAGGILLVLLFGGAAVVGLIVFLTYRSNKRREEEEQAERMRQAESARWERIRSEQRLREVLKGAREDKNKLGPVALSVPSHEPLKSASTVSSTPSHTARNVAVGTALGAAGLGAAALAASAISNKRDEDAERRKREESARRRREEENAARRRRDEEEAASRRRSESSSSSWSSSSSSSSSSWDSGGSSGFGGGDSGGGGGSSDF